MPGLHVRFLALASKAISNHSFEQETLIGLFQVNSSSPCFFQYMIIPIQAK